MRIARVIVSALVLGVLTLRGNAQGIHDIRSGFYGSFGIGYGSGMCSGGSGNCASNQSGVGYYLALGGTLNQMFRLGAEAQLFTKTQGGGTVDVNYYLASLSWYPSGASAFWVKVNAGYTHFTVHLAGVPSTTSSGGVAGGLGVGYDWQPVPGTFVFIPFASYTAQFNASGGDPKGNLLLIGLGFGYKH